MELHEKYPAKMPLDVRRSNHGGLGLHEDWSVEAVAVRGAIPNHGESDAIRRLESNPACVRPVLETGGCGNSVRFEHMYYGIPQVYKYSLVLY